jgi:signal transduction histidine kinase/ABC-type amino acid transport substrate-binding protein/CheY-like chemotaxis protein
MVHARLICAFLGILIFAAATASAQKLKNPLGEGKVLRYGGDKDFRPFEWIDRDVPRGFQVDLIRAMGDEMGTPVHVQLGDWKEVREDLLSGKIDVVGLFEQPSRRDLFDFSDPHAVQGSEIFIRKGSRPIRSLDETIGKEVIVQSGGAAADEIVRLNLRAKLIEVGTELEAIRLLSQGKHDCAIVTQFGGRRAIDVLKTTNIASSSPLILRSNVCFAVRKGNTIILDWLNRGLEAVKVDGHYNDIYKTWFSDLDRPAVPVGKLWDWVLWLGLPLLAGIVLLVGLSHALRSQVDERTSALQRELSERKKAQDSERESVERLKVAIRTANLLVLHQDRELRYTWIYNGHPTIDSGMLLGKTDYEVLPPSIHDFVVQKKLAVLLTGKGTQFEVEVAGPTGNLVFQSLVEPLRDAKGNIYGITSAAIDITVRRQAEAQRIELERRVAHAEKLETLGLLAGGVAHDFNNLLAAILGNASLASQDLAKGTRAADSLAAIERTAVTASQLTQQLLTFTGRGQIPMGPVDVNAEAKETVEVIRGAIPNNVLLIFSGAPGLPQIHGNGAQVRQVILNLVKNGADAVGARAGHVTVRCSAIHADAALLETAALGADASPGDFVCIEVADDGAGMDKETLARTFEVFFTRKAGGRGIGMSVVAAVVQRHRGALFVRSAPHAGTTFRVLFPIAAAGAALPAEEPREARAAGAAQRLRVLVVDDHKSVCEVLCETLVRAGFDATPAGTGGEATQQFQNAKNPFHFVILDLTLPDADGIDLYRSIRAADPNVNIILMSGFDEQGAADAASSDAGALFLQKPFTPRELLSALERLGVEVVRRDT